MKDEHELLEDDHEFWVFENKVLSREKLKLWRMKKSA